MAEHFVGVGNPFSLGEPLPGWNVLDVGCGGGLNSQVAARCVGPEGRVLGVDLSDEMLEVAQQGVAAGGLANVELRRGLAEQLPVESGWGDLVISNGVLNLATCKASAFREVGRTLKPGAASRRSISSWSGSCRRGWRTTSSPGRTELAARYRVGPTWRSYARPGWWTRS